MLLRDTSQLKHTAAGRLRVVVIGSGAVGLHASVRLARMGVDVIVVESGGSTLGSFPAESFHSIGARHDGIRQGRSRTLGGTTNLWGGQLVEFQPVDFSERSWIPGSRWPVAYDEIAPWYAPTYEALGIGPEARIDAAVWTGVGAPTRMFENDMEMFLTRWLKIPNFAALFARDIDTNPNLSVLADHTAVGFVGAGSRIDAVRIIDDRGQERQVGGDVFLVAAGTIESVRLLLHSASTRDWDCPWRDNDHLGTFFQDHVGGRIATVSPRDRRKFFDAFCTIVWRGQKYQPKLRVRSDAVAREQLLNIQAMFAFESSVSENLVYLKQFLKAAVYRRQIKGLGGLFRNMAACARYLPPLMWRYIADHRIFVPSTSKISLVMQGEHMPRRDSRITIDDSWHDAHGLPRVILDWRHGGHEMKAIRAFAQRVDRTLQAAGLASLNISEGVLNADPSFIGSLRDTNHQAGGAIMGESAADGVVDRNLRVFGTSNLYVGGASTFRTTSNANTTFTALAFTTRLVDHLVTIHAVP